MSILTRLRHLALVALAAVSLGATLSVPAAGAASHHKKAAHHKRHHKAKRKHRTSCHIKQGNVLDNDSDNHGASSDGDGCL